MKAQMDRMLLNDDSVPDTSIARVDFGELSNAVTSLTSIMQIEGILNDGMKIYGVGSLIEHHGANFLLTAAHMVVYGFFKEVIPELHAYQMKKGLA